MIIYSHSKYSNIELVDGVFRLNLTNGTKLSLFLYKFKRIENCINPEDIFNTNFNYDLVVLDSVGQNYLYFTYIYIDEPEEVF